MGVQGQLTEGPNVPNPRTTYKRSNYVFAVTSIALIIGHNWPQLVQSFAQSLIGSPVPSARTLEYTHWAFGSLLR